MMATRPTTDSRQPLLENEYTYVEPQGGMTSIFAGLTFPDVPTTQIVPIARQIHTRTSIEDYIELSDNMEEEESKSSTVRSQSSPWNLSTNYESRTNIETSPSSATISASQLSTLYLNESTAETIRYPLLPDISYETSITNNNNAINTTYINPITESSTSIQESALFVRTTVGFEVNQPTVFNHHSPEFISNYSSNNLIPTQTSTPFSTAGGPWYPQQQQSYHDQQLYEQQGRPYQQNYLQVPQYDIQHQTQHQLQQTQQENRSNVISTTDANTSSLVEDLMDENKKLQLQIEELRASMTVSQISSGQVQFQPQMQMATASAASIRGTASAAAVSATSQNLVRNTSTTQTPTQTQTQTRTQIQLQSPQTALSPATTTTGTGTRTGTGASKCVCCGQCRQWLMAPTEAVYVLCPGCQSVNDCSAVRNITSTRSANGNRTPARRLEARPWYEQCLSGLLK